MRRDPDKYREWQTRSARKYRDRVRSETTSGERASKRIPSVNAKRKAKLYERNFGDYADIVRRLPCCACYPELYRNGRVPEPGPERVSDPAHTVARGMGGCGGDKTDLAPLCRQHHSQYDLDRSGYICEHRGPFPTYVAAAVWEKYGTPHDSTDP